MCTGETQEYFCLLAFFFKESKHWHLKGACQGEPKVPVAAVVLDEKGRCIGRGVNQRERVRDPLGHAELLAIRQAALIKNDWRLNGCTLIVTLEPCTMCAGALIQARIGQVIFGVSDKKIYNSFIFIIA